MERTRIIDRLTEPAVLKRLGELRATGCSWKKIRETIEKEFNMHHVVNTTSYKRAYEVYAVRSSEIITGDEEVKGILKKAVLNTAEQLEEINIFMRKILANAGEETADRIAASKEILNHLYFQEKILNRIQEGFNWGKINKLEYTKVSINNLDELAKAGYIKILHKPGEIYDVEDSIQIIEIDKEQLEKFIKDKVIVINQEYKIVLNEGEQNQQK